MISVIIPTRNEPYIEKIIKSVPKHVKKEKIEIVVVDKSDDDTFQRAKKAGARTVKQKSKGKGGAMKEGARSARGDKIVFMDGDNPNPPMLIPKIVSLLEMSDMAVATQLKIALLKKSTFSDKVFALTTLMLLRIAMRLIGFRTTEPITGFRAFRKKSWKRLRIRSNDFRVETEMEIEAVKRGFRIAEMTMPMQSRLSGSKFLSSPQQLRNVAMCMLHGRKILKSKKPEIRKFRDFRMIDYGK